MAKPKVIVSVAKAARLVNLPLDKKTAVKIAPQLNETLTYVESLKKIDTGGVSPTSQVTGLVNVMAQDVLQPSLTVKEALQNAPRLEQSFFVVPGIFKDEN